MTLPLKNLSVVITLLVALLTIAAPLPALELKASVSALQHTLEQQLFNSPDGRYYLEGHKDHGCSMYAEKPQLHFEGSRIVVNVTIKGAFGKSLFGHCLGVPIRITPQVSVVPAAQGEVIVFQDAHIDHLSQSPEFNAIANSFLKNKLPKSMEVNVAAQLRQLMNDSAKAIGYQFGIVKLDIRTLEVRSSYLFVDLDASLTVDADCSSCQILTNAGLHQ
jgi:hypothetical protein